MGVQSMSKSISLHHTQCQSSAARALALDALFRLVAKDLVRVRRVGESETVRDDVRRQDVARFDAIEERPSAVEIGVAEASLVAGAPGERARFVLGCAESRFVQSRPRSVQFLL